MPLPLFRLSPAAQRDWLIDALARPAPPAARNLSDGFRLPGREGAAVPAAVLVPLVNRPEGLQVLLTQRSADLPDHPGQISFPGGRVEPSDVSVDAAALRETTEEVGLSSARVSVLGHLSDYETVTGYRVTPVVGWVEPPFAVAPDPVEVADVFEVPLAFLIDPANQQASFPDAGRAAPRLLGDSLRRALHLGRDGRDAADPRPHAACVRGRRGQLTLMSPPTGGPALGRSAGRLAMMQLMPRSVVAPPPKKPLIALR